MFFHQKIIVLESLLYIFSIIDCTLWKAQNSITTLWVKKILRSHSMISILISPWDRSCLPKTGLWMNLWKLLIYKFRAAYAHGDGEAMAPHSSTLAWKIPWTEEPGRLQSTGLLRVRHDWVTSLSLFTFMHWRRKWQSTPVFLPGESQGWGSLVGCHHAGSPSLGSRLGSRRVGHDWSDLAAACSWKTLIIQMCAPVAITERTLFVV